MSCADYIGEFKPQASNATVIESICRGSNPNYTGSNWFNFWSLNNGTICTSEFSNILYNSFNTVNNPNKKTLRTYDASQLQRVRDNFNNAFRTYYNNFKITNPNQPGYNAFQETLLQSCSDIPGVCDDFLNPFCDNCSRTEISNSSLYTRMCGCRAGDLPSEYNVSKPCDPLCNKSNSIYKIDSITGIPQICLSDVCVIDDININSVNSSVAGNIIFSQLCNSCKNQCNCIISGINLNDTLQKVGLTNETQFNMSCASGTCYTRDSNGVLNPTQCPKSTVSTNNTLPVNLNIGVVLLLILIFIILILGLIAYYT
jgi:hypothetical protein